MAVCFLRVLRNIWWCWLTCTCRSNYNLFRDLGFFWNVPDYCFCLCMFCFACCIRAKQPLFATWISLSHNLHTALNLSLSCDLHHHSSKCPFESFFFSQLILYLVFEWDILKYLVTPQFNLKIITLLIQRKKSMLQCYNLDPPLLIYTKEIAF